MTKRVVIIGGGAAGHAAASSLRKADPRTEIVMATDDDRPPYERPVVSKEFLRGERSLDDALLEPVSGVQMSYGHVSALLPRRVRFQDGHEIAFDGCLIATGSEPVRIQLSNADEERIFTLRELRDAERLRQAVGPGTRVFVIGTGFIACEAALSLRARGAGVTLAGLERAPQLDRLGPDAAERIADLLTDAGVELLADTSVTAMPDADVVLMACGARPRVDLAERAGLRLDGGAIAVDAQLRTTADGVYAAGDVAQAMHPVAGRALRVEHWGDALAQGEAAGANLAGGSAEWGEVPGFWTVLGEHTLKYAAWGDGFAVARLQEHGDGAWTVWYEDEQGCLVGVLTHDRDEDYAVGRERIAAGGED